MSLPTPDAFTNILALQSIIQTTQMLEIRALNSVTGQAQYLGWSSVPNASTADTVWYVIALYYDTNGFFNYQQLPNNGPGFIYSWDLVATYF